MTIPPSSAAAFSPSEAPIPSSAPRFPPSEAQIPIGIVALSQFFCKPASFRLRADLLEGLKRNAERENRTLNNYVESVLLGIVFDEPNEVTKAAIQEAKSGKNPNKVYDNVDELFKDLDSDK